MPTVLVTGALGFIGSNLCIHLVKNGWDVVGVDQYPAHSIDKTRKTTQDELIYATSGYTGRLRLSMVGDVGNEWVMGGSCGTGGPDYVIHLAAQTHVDVSIRDPWPTFSNNVCSTVGLLEAARDWKNLTLFINQITDEVYGPIDEGLEAFEDEPLNPTNPYAASKAGQYYAGLSFFRTFGVPVVSTFPTNTFGPRQQTTKFIPRAISRLLAKKTIPLMASVKNERDWIYIDDHCEALEALLLHGEPGQGYNMGGGQHRNNDDVAHLILDYFDLDDNMIEIIPDRLAHDSRYAVNSGKILREAMWEPTSNFEVSLYKTIEWYLDEANAGRKW